MRCFVIIFVSLLHISCAKKQITYNQVILENNKINSSFLQTIEAPEKALLSWALFAYGNECSTDSKNIKCKILPLLNIDNECSKEHITFLNKWLGKNLLMQYKLLKCPNLPRKFAIQNKIEKIVLKRVSDTLRITVKVRGMNTIQEKFWNIEKTETFILKHHKLIAIK